MIRVLLVDDDLDYLEGETGLLRRSDSGEIDVTPVNELGEAICAVRSGSFDILVTDKNIGGHRGLIPLLTVMKEERPSIPVIINSAEPDTGVQRELYCHGFNDKIRDRSEGLVAKIHQLLGRVTPTTRPMWDPPHIHHPRIGD